MSTVPGIVQRALRTGNDRKPLPESDKADLRALVGDAGFKTLVTPSVLLPAKIALVKETVLKAGTTDAQAKLLLKYVIDGVRTRALEQVKSGSDANKVRAMELLSRERSRSRSRSRSANRTGNGSHQSKKKGPSASSRSRGVRGSGGHNGGGYNNNDDDDMDGGRRKTRSRRSGCHNGGGYNNNDDDDMDGGRRKTRGPSPPPPSPPPSPPLSSSPSTHT